MTHEDLLFRAPDSWLLHMGYLSESSEQNLVLYGYLACPGVLMVECDIDPLAYKIKYLIVLSKRAALWYKLQRWLRSKHGLITSVLLYLVLRAFGSFDPKTRLAWCIKDYAGDRWVADVEVINEREYCSRASRAKAGVLEEGAYSDTAVRR